MTIDEPTFDRLSRYAALLKDGDKREAENVRNSIMQDLSWDTADWVYARDAWLLMLRDKLQDLYQERFLQMKQAADGRGEWPSQDKHEIKRLRRLIENDQG